MPKSNKTGCVHQMWHCGEMYTEALQKASAFFQETFFKIHTLLALLLYSDNITERNINSVMTMVTLWHYQILCVPPV